MKCVSCTAILSIVALSCAFPIAKPLAKPNTEHLDSIAVQVDVLARTPSVASVEADARRDEALKERDVGYGKYLGRYTSYGKYDGAGAGQGSYGKYIGYGKYRGATAKESSYGKYGDYGAYKN